MEYELLSSRSGAETLLVQAEDGRKVFLHSSYDPEREALKWVEKNTSLNKERQQYFLVFGFALGYHIRELKKKFKNAIILVLEPVFHDFTLQKSILGELEQVYILHDCNLSKIASFLMSYVPDFALGELQILFHEQSLHAFPKKYSQIIATVKNAIGAVDVSINTTLVCGKQWTENMLKNFKTLNRTYPVRILDDIFKDKPGIIVSAGPSLDKNIDLLPKVKDKAVIIVVDTALKPVLSKGVKPDFIISIDGKKANYKHFEGLQGKVNAPLICDPSVYPQILSEYSGPIVMALVNPYLRIWFEGLFKDLGELHSGPSVANVAFSFALRLGLEPIIFIGQDLAYPDNKSHASGTVCANKNPIRKKGMLEIDDINGNKVLTDKSLYSMLIWFESAFSQVNNKTIIDATEGGALIQGTQIMNLKEVIKQYICEEFSPAVKLQKILSNSEPNIVLADKFKTLTDIAKSDFSNLLEILKSGRKLAGELEKIYLTSLPSEQKIQNLNIKLDKIDQKIKNFENTIPLLELCFAPVNWSIYKKFKEPDKENPIQKGRRIARLTAALYDGLIESTNIVYSILAE